MNIIVPATSFPRHFDDAAGRFVFDLSRGLAELGHHLIHVVPRPKRPSERARELPSNMEVREFPIGLGNWGADLAYGAGMGPNIARQPWLSAAVPSLLRGLRAGIQSVVDEHPDAVILSHWVFPAGWVAAGIAKKNGLFHVSVAHGGGLQALLKSKITHSWLSKWAEGTDAAVFVSDDLRRKAESILKDRLPKRVLVQPMGIDSRRFRSNDDPKCPASNDMAESTGFRLLGVGRLIELKAFDLLIRAAAEISGASVILCGEGPEEAKLRQLSASLGVNCEFLGQLSPAELGVQYRRADVLVVPSRLGTKGRSEGSPMVVLEAMSQGLPLIASDTGGLPLLAKESGAGLIFKMNESHDLALRIQDLTAENNRRETMKKEAFLFAARHEYSVMAKAVEDLLR